MRTACGALAAQRRHDAARHGSFLTASHRPMERVVKRAAHDILLPTLFIERARRCSLVGEPEPAVCADMGSGDLVIQKDLCSASGWGCMIHLPIGCAGLVGRGN